MRSANHEVQVHHRDGFPEVWHVKRRSAFLAEGNVLSVSCQADHSHRRLVAKPESVAHRTPGPKHTASEAFIQDHHAFAVRCAKLSARQDRDAHSPEILRTDKVKWIPHLNHVFAMVDTEPFLCVPAIVQRDGADDGRGYHSGHTAKAFEFAVDKSANLLGGLISSRHKPDVCPDRMIDIEAGLRGSCLHQIPEEKRPGG